VSYRYTEVLVAFLACVLCTGRDYPTPKQIRNILKPEASGIAVKWYDLGMQLLDDDDGPGVLNVIKADYHNDNNTCCNEMFMKWLQIKPDATWKQLVSALTKIGMNSIAADLKKKLNFGKHIFMPYLQTQYYYCIRVYFCIPKYVCHVINHLLHTCLFVHCTYFERYKQYMTWSEEMAVLKIQCVVTPTKFSHILH